MLSRVSHIMNAATLIAAAPILGMLMPFENTIVKWGDRETKRVLNEFGLKYDDILIESPNVLSAIERLSPEEKQTMERRLTRAFDISLKQKPLPKEMQVGETLDKSDFYLHDHLTDIKHEKEERAKMNWY